MKNIAAEVGTRKRIIGKMEQACFNCLVFNDHRRHLYWVRCCEKWAERGRFKSAWPTKYTKSGK